MHYTLKKTFHTNNGNESFEKMQYNPFNVPSGVFIQDFYSLFQRRAIFHSPQQTSEEIFNLSMSQWDNVLRFIVLFVDIQSPFSSEREFDVRKDLCLSALKIKDPSVIECINSNDVFYSKALFEYFKTINNYKYSLWFTKLTSYFKNTKILLSDEGETDTEKRIKVELDVNKYLTILNEELITLEADLFKDERIKASIKDKAIEEELSGYAERFAKQIEY